MTSYLFVLVLYGTLLQVTDAVDCKRHYNAFGKVEGPKVCDFGQSCCGSCKVRLCCPFPSLLELVPSDIIKLSEDVQDACPNNYSSMWDVDQMFLILVIAGIGFIIISLIIFCCVCPCCCLYEMCRKPRTAVRTTTHTTMVVNNPGSPQAPPCNPSPAPQYPGYQPVPMPSQSGAHPGYEEHPVPSAPMLEQPYWLGPPPPYQENAVTGSPPPYC